MDLLIEKLCKQRLCLPSNSDINLIRKGFIKNNINYCGDSNHIACIFDSKSKSISKIFSRGINKYNSNSVNTVHAEVNAIMNLPSRAKKKCYQKIDICVIKVSSCCKIGISKPCIKCIIDMSILPQKKGYIVKNIYYSDHDGSITSVTLKNLINEGNCYTSRYYRKHNFNPKISVLKLN